MTVFRVNIESYVGTVALYYYEFVYTDIKKYNAGFFLMIIY